MTKLDLSKIDLGAFGITEQQEDLAGQEGQTLQANMGEAFKINPDQHAKTTNLSREAGVPVFAVESDPVDVENRLKLDQIDFTNMSKRNPTTAGFYTDFNRAAIAHDEIDLMSEIEDIFNVSKTFQSIGESIRLGFESQAKGGIAVAIDTSTDRIESIVPVGALPIGLQHLAPMLSRDIANTFGIETDEELAKVKETAVNNIIDELKVVQAKRKAVTPADLNILEQGVRAGIESLANMLPGVVLSVASGGGATPILLTIGTQTFTDSYGGARAEGLSPQEAGLKAGIDAAIEVGTEILPLKTLETIITGTSKGLTKTALKFAVQEMGTEQLATLGQSLNDFAFGLDEEMEQANSVEEMVSIQLRRQAVTAIATVVAGGAQAAAATGINKTLEAIDSHEQAKLTQDEVDQQTLDTMNEVTGDSKTRKRDIEIFKQFIQDSDGENNTHVFIDSAQAALYLGDKSQREIEADPALKMISDSVEAASLSGEDVSIPVEDFASTITGTEHFTNLRDFMTLNSETASPFRQEQQQRETQQYVTALIEAAEETGSDFIQAQEIFTRVRDQLIDTGQVSPQAASTMAEIVPAWATVHAKKNGISVEEAYRRTGLRIEGPQTGERERLEGERELLEQTAADIKTEINAEFSDVKLSLSGKGSVVTLDKIIVPEDLREAGTGTEVINLLINWADTNGKTIALTPSADFGGDKKRLVAFYKRFGFVDNKGKNKDFEISETMLREPQEREVLEQAPIDGVITAADLLEMDAQQLVVQAVKSDVGEIIGTRKDLEDHPALDDVRELAGEAVVFATTNKIRNTYYTVSGKAIRVKNKTGEVSAVDPDNVRNVLKNRILEQEGKKPEVVAAREEQRKLSDAAREEQTELETYHMQHKAPMRADNPTGEDINVVMPDIYTGRALQFYGTGVSYDGKAIDIIQSMGGNPDKEITIYRAVPGDVTEINEGDWVTTTEEYAQDHIGDEQGWIIITKTVKASEIATDGNSIHEWGYSPVRVQGDELLQTEPTPGAVTRGYYDPTAGIIRLTEAADLSTFLHEFAHFMYETELNSKSDTILSINEWFKRNAEAVAKEAGEFAPNTTIIPKHVRDYLDNGTTGDKDRDVAIRRAVHEQFARGFETYVMEGKAPSIELRNAFRTFARWLGQIYRALRGGLNVNVDAEMRQVFDRLLATDEQIAAAQARSRYEPLFTDATMAGMTEEQFESYQANQEKMKEKSTETLRDQLMKEITRQTKKWWKEEKADVVDEVTIDLLNEPVYRASTGLKDGDIKLDHATVKEMVGELRTDKLGRKSTVIPGRLRGMTAKGQAGVHPDEAAAFFGFNSGSEMLTAITTESTLKEAAETQAEAVMIERHGDIMNDGTIEQRADEAVANEERGKIILQELKALAKDTTQITLDRQTIKAIAKERIGRLSFRQVHPGKYRKAEIKAAQEAARMLAEGNREGAARAKARQATNYYLGLEATIAKNETIKIVDRMSRYNKKTVREAIIKAENGYWDQLVKILRRFEFRKTATLKSVDEVNQDINSWSRERIEIDGDGLVLTPAILDESFITHWKNVPFSDLTGISDSVKNIEHVARFSNNITVEQEQIDFKKLVVQWTNHIKEQDQRFATKSTRSRVDDAREASTVETLRRWASQLSKMPFVASWLDGGERVGMSHQILNQRFTDALDEKLNMIDETARPVFDAIMNRSKEDLKRHNRKIFIPEINDSLMGHQILAVALNTGNESNLRKLLLGEQWAEPENDATINIDNVKLQAVLAHMSKSDWQMVQLIWDQMNTLFPKLAEIHRRTTGLVPPEIKATPVQTPFGEFRGGYYPVKYSRKRSHQAEKNAEKADAETESLFSNTASIQASVNTGTTNERTGFYDAIHLSLDVVPDHFNEVIHYITHHEPVRQVNRLIRNNEVADAITGSLGEAEFNQMKTWLNNIAKDGRQQPVKTYIDEIFQRLRFGTTLSIMGFKVSTGYMQLFGIMTTAAELGLGPTLKGIYTTVGRSWYMKAVRRVLGSTDDMQSAWDFAAERSKIMNHRVITMDREIRNAMERLTKPKLVSDTKLGKVFGVVDKLPYLKTIQEVSMKHIALIQTYLVDLPTWIAAYDKSISEFNDENKAVRFADFIVESTQGSGATKDMSTLLQNQNKVVSTMTMFMTFFSSLGALSRDVIKGARTGVYSPTSVAAKIMFLFALPVFFDMLIRGDLDEPEDEDDRLSKFATGVALYPIQAIPVIRDVASGLISDYGYNPSPVFSTIEKGIAGFKQISERSFTDEDFTKTSIKNAVKLTGAILGLPGTSQTWATGEHLYDVMEEGEELTFRELSFGPKRD